MLWKAANNQAPPAESTDVTQFGWEIVNDIPTPVIVKGNPAPPELIDVICCQCKARGKKFSTVTCGCHKEHLSCTSYFNCSGGRECFNPHTKTVTSNDDSNGDEIDDADLQDFDVEDECEDYDDVADDGSVNELLNDEWE